MSSRRELDAIEAMLREVVEHLRSARFADHHVRELHMSALALKRDVATWHGDCPAAERLRDGTRRAGELLARARQLRSK